MIDIYICEDDKKQLNVLEKYISEIIMFEEYDMQLALATNNPYQLLEYSRRSENVGLYFLDIELSREINGLQLAQEIRRLDPRGFIIFITSHSEMSFLTFQYKVEALDFIIKDNPVKIRPMIQDCIMNVNEKYLSSLNSNRNKIFSIAIGNKRIVIDYEDILFFETSTNTHKVILHAQNRSIEFNAQLKELGPNLDSSFYRCHRSYIVNRNNIKEVDFTNCIIHMNNGETCLLSTRLKKGLK